MTEITASRTLVKSPPELWAECSDAESLARHLNGTFGEIRITRLEPETAVAWEGEQFSGTVRLEPAGWGTKVVMTAAPAGADVAASQAAAEPAPVSEPEPPALPDPEPEALAEPEPAPEPVPEPEVAPAPRRGFFARLFGFGRRAPDLAAELEAVEPELIAADPAPDPVEPDPDPDPDPDPQEPSDPEAAADLVAALESLGQAHHRPFSRG